MSQKKNVSEDMGVQENEMEAIRVILTMLFMMVVVSVAADCSF